MVCDLDKFCVSVVDQTILNRFDYIQTSLGVNNVNVYYYLTTMGFKDFN